jgi:hypothetical protein
MSNIKHIVLMKHRSTPLDRKLRDILDNRDKVLTDFIKTYESSSVHVPKRLSYNFSSTNTGPTSVGITDIRVSYTLPILEYPILQDELEIYDFFFDVYIKYRNLLLSKIADEIEHRRVSVWRRPDDVVNTIIMLLHHMVFRMSEGTLTRSELSELHLLYRDHLGSAPPPAYAYNALMILWSHLRDNNPLWLSTIVNSSVVGSWYNYVYNEKGYRNTPRPSQI